MTHLAIRRRSDVVSRVEGDETLVLDLRTQTAHCLSGDVAMVWGATETSVETLASALGLSADAVESAAASLAELDLVDVGSSGMSRRMLVRGAAVGGAVVAAGVVSIPLPAAANANSSTMTITKTGCTSGNSHKVDYTIALTSGKLAASATYNVSVTYTSGGTGTTDTVTITTDSSGQIQSGASQTTASKVQSNTAVTVTVTRVGNSSDTLTFTGSFTAC